jgi:hypothetical protein
MEGFAVVSSGMAWNNMGDSLYIFGTKNEDCSQTPAPKLLFAVFAEPQL